VVTHGRSPFLQDQGGPPSQNIDFAVSILDQGQPAPDVPWDAEQSIDLNQTIGQLFQEVLNTVGASQGVQSTCGSVLGPMLRV
jgi:hypothetical protein